MGNGSRAVSAVFWMRKLGTAQVMSRKVGRFFEVNRRAVFAGRAVGMARERLVRFCALMNMPTPMSKSTYQRHQAALLNAANTVAKQSHDNAAETVRKLGEEEGSTSPGDIPVTFDGTWMRRGHTFVHGAVTVISLATGQLLDYEVYTKFCHTCTRNRSDVAAGRMTQVHCLVRNSPVCGDNNGILWLNGGAGCARFMAEVNGAAVAVCYIY